MELNKKNRTELKSFFQANNIPTQQHFEQFIDAGFNQAEDGIIRIPGSPLSIQAEGQTVGTQEILNLFSDFNQNIPDWSLNLNPRIDPQEPGSNQPGFNIKDITGQSRLFIQSGDGNIGVGTIEPESKLTIQGAGDGSLIAAIANTQEQTRIFEVNQDGSDGMLSLRGGNNQEAVRLSGGIDKPGFFLNKIGIGTNSPDEQLHVSGGKIKIEGTQNTYLSVLETGSARESRFWTHTDGKLYIQNNNGIELTSIGTSNRLMSILDTGNVGIGTHTPSEKLEVAGNMLVTSDDQSELRIVSTSSLSASWRTRLYMDRGHDFRSGGVWIDATAENQPIWFSGVPYQGNGYQIGHHSSQPEYRSSAKLFIEENGNVGIGTTSPNTKLEVVGGPMRAGGVLATSQAEYTEIGHGGSHGYISTTGDGNLDFRHDEDTKMSITSGGNVGIGISTPADKLDVRGTLRISTSNNHARMYVGTIPGRGIGLVFTIKSSQHGSNRQIIWDGDNNWDSPSDERLKTNINQERNILERLVQLDVKNYTWKDPSNQKNAEPIIGFMAQEVKPLFPSLVGGTEDEDTGKKLMTLKYASFGVLAVGAIKELRAEKDAEIAKHKQLIDALKTRVETLEKQLV